MPSEKERQRIVENRKREAEGKRLVAERQKKILIQALRQEWARHGVDHARAMRRVVELETQALATPNFATAISQAFGGHWPTPQFLLLTARVRRDTAWATVKYIEGQLKGLGVDTANDA